MQNPSNALQETQDAPSKKVFLACFVALVTISVGFIIRALTLPQWGSEFNLTNAIFPVAMLVCYLLMWYFNYKGGYRVILPTPEESPSPTGLKE